MNIEMKIEQGNSQINLVNLSDEEFDKTRIFLMTVSDMKSLNINKQELTLDKVMESYLRKTYNKGD